MSEEKLLELAVSSTSFLFAVMITTALSGKLVRMGERWGFIYPKKRFQPFPKLLFFFLVEAVLLSLLFGYIETWISPFLQANISWLPAIWSESFFLYYIWFCDEYKFKMHPQYIVIPQVLALVNYLIVQSGPPTG